MPNVHWALNQSPDVLRALKEAWVLELYEALAPMFKKTWFTRLWVLQEVVLARHTGIIFGTCSMSFDYLMRPLVTINDVVDSSQATSFFGSEAWGRLRDTFDDRYWYWHRRENFSMFDVLAHSSSLNATDERDKIFAILGLRIAPGFLAGYTLSVRDVFKNFTLWSFRFTRNLEALLHSGLALEPSNMASWCLRPRRELSLRMDQIKHFNVSKQISTPRHVAPDLPWELGDKDTLAVAGRDTVQDQRNTWSNVVAWVKISRCSHMDDYERLMRLSSAMTGNIDNARDMGKMTVRKVQERCYWLHNALQEALDGERDKGVDAVFNRDLELRAIYGLNIQHFQHSQFCITESGQICKNAPTYQKRRRDMCHTALKFLSF